jgi:hypothetical protein
MFRDELNSAEGRTEIGAMSESNSDDEQNSVIIDNQLCHKARSDKLLVNWDAPKKASRAQAELGARGEQEGFVACSEREHMEVRPGPQVELEA